MAYHGRDRLKHTLFDASPVPPSHRYSSAASSHRTPTASSSSSPPVSSPLNSHIFALRATETYLRTSIRTTDSDSSPTLPCALSATQANWGAYNSTKPIDHEIAYRQRLHEYDEYACDTRHQPNSRVSGFAEQLSHVADHGRRTHLAAHANNMSSSPQRHAQRHHFHPGAPSCSSSTPSEPERRYWATRNGSTFVDSDYEQPPLTSEFDNGYVSSDGEVGVEFVRDNGEFLIPRIRSDNFAALLGGYVIP